MVIATTMTVRLHEPLPYWPMLSLQSQGTNFRDSASLARVDWDRGCVRDTLATHLEGGLLGRRFSQGRQTSSPVPSDGCMQLSTHCLRT